MKCIFILALVALLISPEVGGFLFGVTYTEICDKLCRCPEHVVDANDVPLDCRDNNITSIPDKTIVPLEITRIDFTRNYIQKITPDTFYDSEQLTGIDYSVNDLEVLPERAFESTYKLKYLIFRNNKLNTIDEKAFVGLGNLTSLDLSYNQLRDLPCDVFSHVPTLEELILDFNDLSELNSIHIGRNTRLHTLHLSSVGIKTLHPDFLSRNLTSLAKLTLAFNGIVTIPSKAFHHVRDSLKELDLTGNPIQTLGAYSFYGLSNLKRLRLDQMLKLESIDAFAFGDLKHMESISIQYMPKIESIDPKAFYGSDNNPNTSSPILVEDFTFCYSVLSTLPEDLLEWDKLRYINLGYNHWNCDCHMQWIKNSSLMKLVGEQMVCSLPTRLRGHRMISVPKEDMNCLTQVDGRNASLGILIGIICAGIGVSLATVALLVYMRQGWIFSKPPYGAYTSIERGASTITVVDEMEFDDKQAQKD